MSCSLRGQLASTADREGVPDTVSAEDQIDVENNKNCQISSVAFVIVCDFLSLQKLASLRYTKPCINCVFPHINILMSAISQDNDLLLQFETMPLRGALFVP